MSRAESDALQRERRGTAAALRRAPRGLMVIPGGDGPRSDDDLLRDFLRGQEEAFAELVRRHERAVRAVVRRYAERPDDVLDLAQRAFVRALESARRAPWLRLGRLPP